jgi:ATP synthase protein I
MNEEPDDKDGTDARDGTSRSSFSRQIRAQEARKLRAQQRAVQSIWFGFGMFGLVGWSVAIPTLLGAALGLWLDRKFPGAHSWTLTLLIIGVIVGCANGCTPVSALHLAAWNALARLRPTAEPRGRCS